MAGYDLSQLTTLMPLLEKLHAHHQALDEQRLRLGVSQQEAQARLDQQRQVAQASLDERHQHDQDTATNALTERQQKVMDQALAMAKQRLEDANKVITMEDHTDPRMVELKKLGEIRKQMTAGTTGGNTEAQVRDYKHIQILGELNRRFADEYKAGRMLTQQNCTGFLGKLAVDPTLATTMKDGFYTAYLQRVFDEVAARNVDPTQIDAILQQSLDGIKDRFTLASKATTGGPPADPAQLKLLDGHVQQLLTSLLDDKDPTIKAAAQRKAQAWAIIDQPLDQVVPQIYAHLSKGYGLGGDGASDPQATQPVPPEAVIGTRNGVTQSISNPADFAGTIKDDQGHQYAIPTAGALPQDVAVMDKMNQGGGGIVTEKDQNSAILNWTNKLKAMQQAQATPDPGTQPAVVATAAAPVAAPAPAVTPAMFAKMTVKGFLDTHGNTLLHQVREDMSGTQAGMTPKGTGIAVGPDYSHYVRNVMDHAVTIISSVKNIPLEDVQREFYAQAPGYGFIPSKKYTQDRGPIKPGDKPQAPFFEDGI